MTVTSATTKPTASTFDEIKNQVINIDKKTAPPAIDTIQFMMAMGIGIPFYLFILLPMTIVLGAGEVILSKISPSSKKETEVLATVDVTRGVPDKIPNKEDRKYDLVLLGSTGFVGSLATKYLVKTYGVNKKVKWAIAGRSIAKLNKLKKDVAEELNDDSINDVDMIIVDTSVHDTLPDLVSNTRCVASSAGPFALYGSNVVEYCAKYGTNYVDITGEVDWVRDMQMFWEETARKTGAKLISCCGHDAIPWDLSVHLLSDYMQEECKDDLVKVEVMNDMKGGGASGGTLATIFLLIDEIMSGGGGKKKKSKVDPFMALPDGSKSTYNTKNKNVAFMEKCAPQQKKSFVHNYNWSILSLMGGVNYVIVKRSHALRCATAKTAEKVTLDYKEGMLVPNFQTAATFWFGLSTFFTALANPITRFILRYYVLPKPGEGPTPQQMNDGYLVVQGYGKGSNNNNIVESMLYFPKEAGYMDTARLMVESGLCLALEDEKDMRMQGGGFFSPAACMGDVLLKRLCDTGSMYSLRVSKKSD